MSKADQEDKNFETSLTVARQGGIVIAGSLVSNVLRFVLQVVLGRLLGAEKYGLYTLGFSLFAVTGQISQLGLPDGIIKFGAQYSAENDCSRLKGMLRLAILIAAVASIVATIGVFAFAPYIAKNIFHKNELSTVIKLFALSIPFYTFAILSAAITRSMQKIFYYALIQFIMHPSIYIILIGILFLVGMDVINVVQAFTCTWVIISIFSIIVIIKICPFLRLKVKPVYEFKKLTRFATPVFLAELTPIVLNHFDKLILGNLLTAGDVGVYNAASRIAAQIVFFMQALNLIFAPLVADLYHKNKMAELGSLFKIITRWTITLTLPISLWIMIFAGSIMMLFGNDFINGKNVLILCCFAQLTAVCAGPSVYVLIMTGKQDMHLVNNMVLIIVNVIVNIILIKKFGVMGAALAITICYVFINLIRLVEIYVMYRIQPYSLDLLKSIFAALIASVCVFILSKLLPFSGWVWILSSALFFACYTLSLYFMGFNEEDHVILSLAKTKFKAMFLNHS